MEKKQKREIIGKVTSDKGDKTIIVSVETYRKDSKYGKRIKYSKKYSVHDEKNEAKIGDKVSIIETRPLSKTKHYSLKKIIEKAVIL